MAEEHDERDAENQEAEEKPRERRVRRWRIGWYTIPALFLVALTVWLLANMAKQSGNALIRVLVGIVVVLAIGALVYKAIERPTKVD
jgi:predicted nucleic acid-binding Zn ribbon protein